MDAKSLLRAKKASARIEHPYAAYNASGQLRCSVCAVPVQQWDAHLLTKQHRTSVAREKALQAKTSKPKRPAEESISPELSKKSKTAGGTSVLPAGFFSSGQQPVSIPLDDDEEEEEETPKAGPSRVVPPPSSSNPPPQSVGTATGDAELDDFLNSLSADTPEIPPPAPTVVAKRVGTTSYKSSSSSGIPGQASYEAAPIRNIPQEEEVKEEEPQETEAEMRERIAREEREEILGRLEEEERAQEDADSRVAMLKARMELLKKKREAAGSKVNGKTNGAKAKLGLKKAKAEGGDS